MLGMNLCDGRSPLSLTNRYRFESCLYQKKKIIGVCFNNQHGMDIIYFKTYHIWGKEEKEKDGSDWSTRAQWFIFKEQNDLCYVV